MSRHADISVQCVCFGSDDTQYFFRGSDGVELKCIKTEFVQEDGSICSRVHKLKDPVENFSRIYIMSPLIKEVLVEVDLENPPVAPVEVENLRNVNMLQNGDQNDDAANALAVLDTNKGHKWEDKETKALIALYQKYKTVFRRKNSMWTKIAADISEDFKIAVDSISVKNRWFTINKPYKKANDNNKKSGRGPKKAKYMNELNEALAKQKDINPTALSSSLHGLQSTNQMASQADSEDDDYNNESFVDEPEAIPATDRSSSANKAKQNESARKKISPATQALQHLVKKVDEMSATSAARNALLKTTQEEYVKDLVHAQKYRELNYNLKKAMLEKENPK